MTPIIEQYHFKKFWDLLEQTNYTISQWDSRRTDRNVLVRRTLNKWFTGKFFKVKRELETGFFKDTKHKTWDRQPATIYGFEYVLIAHIMYAYTYKTQITIFYYVPHSPAMQSMTCSYNFLYNLCLQEDKDSYLLLSKFYPYEEIKEPEMVLPPLPETKKRGRKPKAKP